MCMHVRVCVYERVSSFCLCPVSASVRLCQVLLEFKEYATEVDVDFVRKAVRAIGRCAIKLEKAAERCITVLLELIKIKVNYVVQEAIIVIKDIFRRYPNTCVHSIRKTRACEEAAQGASLAGRMETC